MPIIDSKTMQVTKDYSVDEIVVKAREMRAINMVAITAAKSGHTGGTLSIMDIAAALYLKQLRHDPANPEWDDRDRVFWSAGHKVPALYAALGMAGYFDLGEMVKLRKIWSGFEGHPNRLKIRGIEASSGSLGQGLGIAVGSALRARLDGKSYRVYCIMGDGEQQEGSVWEAAMSAGHYMLSNLTAIIDRNTLQIDGPTDAVMKIEPLAAKYEAFGWNAIEIDGHDVVKILEAFRAAEACTGKPTVIIADTVKGKGVSYAENVTGYHGIPPKDGRYGNESLEKAINDIYGGDTTGTPYSPDKVEKLLQKAKDYQDTVNIKINSVLPAFSKDYWWNRDNSMKVKMDSQRFGFGKAIKAIGEDPRVMAVGADISGSIRLSDFYSDHPERKHRFISAGIAEQNMTVIAAGLAKEGKIPFIGSYGVFTTGRNWDQIRTTCCYNNYNVKIASAHGGISVGADGATHQALEDIAIMACLPNMHIEVPCDFNETVKSTYAIYKLNGPAMVRFAREATPIVTDADTPFEFGMANIIRYRGAVPEFADAFETILSRDYVNENEDISIIACGPVVTESMRAAYILKEEYGIETRVINMHTVKPIDVKAITDAADQTRAILTVEEHQTGGFGNIVAGAVCRNGKSYKLRAMEAMDMIGIDDRFGESGEPWELMKSYGLTAESICLRAKAILLKTSRQ